MTTRFKKNRKKRGHVSAGHGRVGKHRKHPGGRGNAGGLHHHRILMDKYHPGHFGKLGMRHYHLKRNQLFCPSVNLAKLWSLCSKSSKEVVKDNEALVVDTLKLGYGKVLGRGQAPNVPMIVKAKYFSKQAEAKIKNAGGACVLVA